MLPSQDSWFYCRTIGEVMVGSVTRNIYFRDLGKFHVQDVFRGNAPETLSGSLQPQSYLSIPSCLPLLTSIVLYKMQAFSRCARPALQAAVRRQGYSTATSAYAATAENLRINKDTKVIYQGFTGKQGT
jgi:hypothetical protein